MLAFHPPTSLRPCCAVRLRVAAQRRHYDAVTIKLIADAVKSLEEQQSRAYLESDIYPIVTLAEWHVGALVRHNQIEAARETASGYFKQLDRLARQDTARQLADARERLAYFLSTGEWHEGYTIRYAGKRRRK